jgi:hypothetical protein
MEDPRSNNAKKQVWLPLGQLNVNAPRALQTRPIWANVKFWPSENDGLTVQLIFAGD